MVYEKIYNAMNFIYIFYKNTNFQKCTVVSLGIFFEESWIGQFDYISHGSYEIMITLFGLYNLYLLFLFYYSFFFSFLHVIYFHRIKHSMRR